MCFHDYLISIGGLIGLWQGLSIIDIKNKIYFIAYFIIKKIKFKVKTSEANQLFLKIYLYIGNKVKVS
jgi:hypothetical protein